jgi:peptide subunit release factor 1 (eRF1)
MADGYQGVMERSGRTAPAAHELDDLRQLTLADGPFLTVWASRPGLSVKDIPQHADETVVDAVNSAFPASSGVVVVADSSGVLLNEPLDDAPRADIARMGALPSLAPVIEQRQSSIAFMLVVTDRRGADLYWSDTQHSGSRLVEGDDTFITKVHAGGWSQKNFQQRAENTWEHTADEIASEVTKLFDSVKPRLIAIAGDLRMTELLRSRLPAACADLLRDVPGGRSEDGSDENREEALQRWIRTAIAEDTVAALQLFDQEQGQEDRALSGTEATLVALCEARVDTLLVHDDGSQTGVAYYVPDEPSLVAVDPQTLTAMGRSDVRSARLIDVAIRAALHTDAGIRIVPTTPRLADGIGAILRW